MSWWQIVSLFALLFVLLALLLLSQLGEGGVGVGHELLRRVVLKDSALVEEQDLVTIDDRIETMSNGEHSCTLELLLNDLLDGLFGDDVNVGSCFIENDELVATKDGSDDANELTLADRQVLSFLLNLEEETFAVFFFLLSLLFGGLLFLVFLLLVILLLIIAVFKGFILLLLLSFLLSLLLVLKLLL